MNKQVDNNMKSPFTGGLVYLVEDTEVQVFRKEQYTVHVRYYECKDTGEQFTTEEQDEQLCNELYNQYRIRHGIPFPDEIKKNQGTLWTFLLTNYANRRIWSKPMETI